MEVVRDLQNDVISSDLELPLTYVLRSRQGAYIGEYLKTMHFKDKDCFHGSWTCSELSRHWRLFVLVSSFFILFSG